MLFALFVLSSARPITSASCSGRAQYHGPSMPALTATARILFYTCRPAGRWPFGTTVSTAAKPSPSERFGGWGAGRLCSSRWVPGRRSRSHRGRGRRRGRQSCRISPAARLPLPVVAEHAGAFDRPPRDRLARERVDGVAGAIFEGWQSPRGVTPAAQVLAYHCVDVRRVRDAASAGAAFCCVRHRRRRPCGRHGPWSWRGLVFCMCARRSCFASAIRSGSGSFPSGSNSAA
jgi:hypothetical protein